MFTCDDDNQTKHKMKRENQRVCGKCRWYEERKIGKNKVGCCTWPIPDYIWPMSIERTGIGGKVHLYKLLVFSNTDAVDCICFDDRKT